MKWDCNDFKQGKLICRIKFKLLLKLFTLPLKGTTDLLFALSHQWICNMHFMSPALVLLSVHVANPPYPWKVTEKILLQLLSTLTGTNQHTLLLCVVSVQNVGDHVSPQTSYPLHLLIMLVFFYYTSPTCSVIR